MNTTEKQTVMIGIVDKSMATRGILYDCAICGVLTKPLTDHLTVGHKILNRFEHNCLNNAKTAINETLAQFLIELEQSGKITINNLNTLNND